MANRCLASRTNAWTAVDHTCYTVYTAGTSGFLQILPIYLDHILFPTLRKEDFATEVHHISGRGRYMLLRVAGEPVKCFFANGVFAEKKLPVWGIPITNSLCKPSVRRTLEKLHVQGTKWCFCTRKRDIFASRIFEKGVADFLVGIRPTTPIADEFCKSSI